MAGGAAVVKLRGRRFGGCMIQYSNVQYCMNVLAVSNDTVRYGRCSCYCSVKYQAKRLSKEH